jgi:hypothetical protein
MAHQARPNKMILGRSGARGQRVFSCKCPAASRTLAAPWLSKSSIAFTSAGSLDAARQGSMAMMSSGRAPSARASWRRGGSVGKGRAGRAHRRAPAVAATLLLRSFAAVTSTLRGVESDSKPSTAARRISGSGAARSSAVLRKAAHRAGASDNPWMASSRVGKDSFSLAATAASAWQIACAVSSVTSHSSKRALSFVAMSTEAVRTARTRMPSSVEAMRGNTSSRRRIAEVSIGTASSAARTVRRSESWSALATRAGPKRAVTRASSARSPRSAALRRSDRGGSTSPVWRLIAERSPACADAANVAKHANVLKTLDEVTRST